MQKKYADQGLQIAFVTQMYGFFGEQKEISAEAELAADAKYWLEEHKMPVKIGIDITPMIPDTVDKSGKKMKYARSGNLERYFVEGIPTFVLIDRHGKVRYLGSGGGLTVDESLSKEIEKLLSEKISSAP